MRFLFLLFIFQLSFSQEKSKLIYNNETVYINLKQRPEVVSFVQKRKHITKSTETKDYTERIFYSNFNEISEISGFTNNPKKDKIIRLRNNIIGTYDADVENVFHSDQKVKAFIFEDVADDCEVEYSFKNKYKEIKLLSSFYFQDNLKTDNAKFQIICDKNIEIGYQLFGEFQDKIKFSEINVGNNIEYTWDASEIPAIEMEDNSPNKSYYVPHIIYYIKSYTINNNRTEVLASTKDLHNWYVSLVNNINKTDQDNLKTKTLELIKDLKLDFEKAKAIYNWIQENLQYVAFEYGMGGYIPRNASEVFEKKYGDCKDMANLTNEMFHYANLKSYLTWIGTRHKPYTYEDVPTPIADNHMIVTLEIDGKKNFIDATDKFCQFPLPSTMIQGKEALIGMSEKEFLIEKVPTINSGKNKTTINIVSKLEGNAIVGQASATYSGSIKSKLMHFLSVNNTKETEIWKKYLVYSNEKIIVSDLQTQKNTYENKHAELSCNLRLENWVKDLQDQFILKPILLFPFADANFDSEIRKHAIEKDCLVMYEINYEFEIPINYKVGFVPENNKIQNDLLEFDLSYSIENNKIKVKQIINSNTLLLEKKDFEKWNTTIKNLIKQYNQSIILRKA
jgi:hypothetical protein